VSHRSYTTVLDQPAGGADWSFRPSTSDWSRLLSIVGVLTTNLVDDQRVVAVTVTDDTGNLMTYDAPNLGQAGSVVTRYSWRSGSVLYSTIDEAGALIGSIPGFWLPPGAVVAAQTANIQGGAGTVQAASDTGTATATAPATITMGVNDQFVWTGAGGGGPAVTYTIAPGVYATLAAIAAAINAALHGGSAFHLVATCAINAGTGDTTFTAVADIGAAGNGDTATTGANDSFTTIFGATPTFTLDDGADAYVGDQWTSVVATFVVADARHWLTLEAMIDQYAAAR
jgi:hypothetical protein